jgi:hypothetical protein
MRTLFASALAVLGLVLIAGTDAAQDKGKKYTIKEVMQEAHKKGGPMLRDKVISGKASDEEKKTLLAMYKSLAAQKPPAGEADSWKEKTAALVEAAKLAVDGDKGAAKALKKAANCMGCHNAHKS